MSLQTVIDALKAWPQPRLEGNRVLVPTHCIFGSGGVVTVAVEGGADTFQVHDDGAAIEEFEANGGHVKGAWKLIAALLRDRGFIVDEGGRIIAPIANLAELPATISLTANAAKEAADHLMERWRPVSRRKFKDEVRNLLEIEFPKHWARDREFIGQSNKPHKFDFVVEGSHQRQLVLDAVVPEATAISSATVRHLDLRASNPENVVQRILYDDSQPWKASDLNLLKLGAPPVPFSQAREVLERLAA